ncbi:hypothetical protein [Thermoflavimicrobium dichotomicum]|uniref:Uncharacterized protein n=1 Tax=Thermoflavimicrobium dichotomicum TaxID=46223 RepID=A0A1I3LIT3_9BACL|nr:hypothetical protein [Thermoflavimicrobium dichotomicum]SFI84627.1 hypothetical protein SAMN05421852_102211 [Thermoflavimicrobium dichotomicum]
MDDKKPFYGLSIMGTICRNDDKSMTREEYDKVADELMDLIINFVEERGLLFGGGLKYCDLNQEDEE